MTSNMRFAYSNSTPLKQYSHEPSGHLAVETWDIEMALDGGDAPESLEPVLSLFCNFLHAVGFPGIEIEQVHPYVWAIYQSRLVKVHAETEQEDDEGKN
jgi:hypothetical protein